MKGSTSTLTISKADMSEIGVYKVVADNGKERIETQANVDVCGTYAKAVSGSMVVARPSCDSSETKSGRQTG